MGQATYQFRHLMSLRGDRGRLSLESVLTGTALWLAFLYLMKDGAAAGPVESRQAGASTGDGEAPDPRMAPSAGGSGSSGTPPAPLPPAPPGAGSAEGGLSVADRPGTTPGGEPWLPLPGEDQTPPVHSAATPGGPPMALQSPAAGSSSFPWSFSLPGSGAGGTARTDLEADASDPIDDSSDPNEAARAVPGQGREASMARETEEPEIPGLRVVLRSDESLVSRSVDGVATTQYSNSLGAITDAVIDLRAISAPQVQVSSDRELHLLALSVLNDAALTLESRNTGLNRSALLLGPEANEIRLQVSDDIDLGLLAGGLARGQVLQSLIGMLDSRLQDAGGGGTLELVSLARIHLLAPGTPTGRQLGIDLLAQAMQDSAILLGDGDDRVTIASGFRSLDGTGPGLLLTIPAADATGGSDSLQLRARALGLVNSLLDTGGGDDRVSIATWLDGSLPAPSQAIALQDSAVVLGEGDDLLSVEGAVIGSRIALGSGANELVVAGPMHGSTVVLAPESSNAIRLGDANDALRITLDAGPGAELVLDAGAGDDRILLPLADLTGSIDAGAGVDSLRNASGDEDGVVEWPPQDPVLAVSLDGPGTGTIGSLGFRGLENLSLGDTGAVVAVGALGSLEGRLEAGRGLDALDYSAWQEPVAVDLISGEASGILGGITGFEAVRGGSGDDRFVLDLSLLAGSGESLASAPVVHGGQGRDRFVLSGMEAIRSLAGGHDQTLPVLADLERSPGSGAGIWLTDDLSWRLGGILLGTAAAETTVDLTPAGLEGIGQPRLLPIAPLEELVRGMGMRPTGIDQLAIATGELGSRLVLLGSDRSVTAIAELPGLQSVNVASTA